jgi:regulator of protease activity HflC (stomatin/prohibitin superfamily)
MNHVREPDKVTDILFLIASALALFVTIALIIWALCAGGRIYDVWAQRKAGEAELAHAESNRQIKTLEAQAAMESSKHLANAEIIRARGVAEANKIIGDSLHGNEGYLRYLWIQGLQTNQMQVVYVPTEANLPIMESSRLR